MKYEISDSNKYATSQKNSQGLGSIQRDQPEWGTELKNAWKLLLIQQQTKWN